MSYLNSNWDDQTRLRYDPCARAQYDKESASPVNFITDKTGFRWCESNKAYSKLSEAITHYPKVYRNGCKVDNESTLFHTPLTNMRYKHQLLHRPYLGAYMGAGQSTSSHKDTESELIYGLDTRGGTRRACDVLSGVTIDRFECLPEYGNPQRVKHIVPTAWIRGGDNTRDYVRRVNYEAKMLNKKNNQIINNQKKIIK
jgi:hypothetical protein